jgi:TetR/AcrR family transcriptional repressor of lmrAB and yxaGH operons
MDRRRTDTRERMVRAALELFRKQGLHGTGFTDVLEATGASRGVIYHHFPGGKEELAAAVIETNGQDLHALFEELLSDQSPGDAFRRFIGWYVKQLDKTALTFGCPIAPTVLEAGLHSDAVSEAASTVLNQWSRQLSDSLHQAGLPLRRARDIADTVIAGFEGALVIVRARRSTAPLRAIGAELAQLMDRAVADA